MNAQKRSILWPVLVVVVGTTWLLMAIGIVPESVGDLLTRSWPALLLLLGFDLLAGRRRVRLGQRSIPLSLVAVGLTVIVLGIVIWQAYMKQADEVRADSVVTFTKDIGEDVTTLRLEMDLKRTAVEIVAAPEGTLVLDAKFTGSEESDVLMAWDVNAGVGSLTISEQYRNTIPKLEDYGKGTLSLSIPPGVAVELINVESVEGSVISHIQSAIVQRLEVATGSGSIEVDLPFQDALTGILRTDNGNIRITVPADIPLRVRLAEGSANPEYDYDEMRYYLLAGGTLERRNAEYIQAELAVDVSGTARVTVEDVSLQE